MNADPDDSLKVALENLLEIAEQTARHYEERARKIRGLMQHVGIFAPGDKDDGEDGARELVETIFGEKDKAA
jgi:hypothetical protein